MSLIFVGSFAESWKCFASRMHHFMGLLNDAYIEYTNFETIQINIFSFLYRTEQI